MSISIPLNKKNVNKLPGTIAVYLFKQKKHVIYVGKSINLRARIRSHLENSKLNHKEAVIIKNSDSVECHIVNSEFKAILLEAELIRRFQPKYNTRWKDDRSLLYIQMTTHETYPKIFPTRKTSIANKKSIYFGPFSSNCEVMTILKEVRKIIPFCSQKNLGPPAVFLFKNRPLSSLPKSNFNHS